MHAYVGVTDGRWYRFLATRPELTEINFWRPGGRHAFRVLQPGEPFFRIEGVRGSNPLSMHAGHNEGGGRAGGDGGPVLGDHRPVVRRQRLVKVAANVADAVQVRRVEVSHGGDSLGQNAGPEPVVAAAALDGVHRL